METITKTNNNFEQITSKVLDNQTGDKHNAFAQVTTTNAIKEEMSG